MNRKKIQSPFSEETNTPLVQSLKFPACLCLLHYSAFRKKWKPSFLLPAMEDSLAKKAHILGRVREQTTLFVERKGVVLERQRQCLEGRWWEASPGKEDNLPPVPGDRIRKDSFSLLPLSWDGKDQHKCSMLNLHCWTHCPSPAKSEVRELAWILQHLKTQKCKSRVSDAAAWLSRRPWSPW